MFDVILSPIVAAVRTWMADRVYKAARDGATAGLTRFAHDFGRQFTDAELPPPEAQPVAALPMPSAAQTTSPDDTPSPALDVPLYERAKALIEGGLSQRQAAQQLGIPESTLRGWLKREG